MSEVSVPKYRVKQALFQGPAPDGARVAFVSLADGRCALLRDDQLVAAWGIDAYGVDDGVRRYLDMTDGVHRIRPAPRAPARSSPGLRRRAALSTPAVRENR